MKSTQSIGNDQVQPTGLRLYIPPYKVTFDPDCDALDFLTSEVLSELNPADWTPPFELQFFGADQVLVGESCVTMRNDKLGQQTVFRRCGFVRVPLICKLVDALGQTHERVLSEEETRKWVSGPQFEGSYFDGSYIDGSVINVASYLPSDSRNFSAVLLFAVGQLLNESTASELEPPFTIEFRDGQGQLFQESEVHFNNEGKYFMRKDIADCAHLPFPITVKLISQKGAELTRTVQRLQ